MSSRILFVENKLKIFLEIIYLKDVCGCKFENLLLRKGTNIWRVCNETKFKFLDCEYKTLINHGWVTYNKLKYDEGNTCVKNMFFCNRNALFTSFFFKASDE